MLLTFSNIHDQPQAIDWLRRAYLADRLPHGLIFAGPAGVGKATTARALATLFLCHAPSGDTPCAKCESCRLMAAPNPNHPDFLVVYRQLVRLEKSEAKARDLSVDVIRDHLVKPANLKPALNHGKVFIVEEADLMNAAAQNSLLKTLEEPYPRTLIILLTDQPESLLQTIRSRTQLVRFHSLSPQFVAQELARRNIDKATAALAAELSEGSLGSALRWIDDGVVASAQTLLRLVDDLTAHRPHGDIAEWFKAAADAYSKKQLERDPQASADQTKREGLSLYLRLAANRFRRLMRQSDDPAQVELAVEAIEAIARADEFLWANLSVPLVFQQLAMTLSRLAAA